MTSEFIQTAHHEAAHAVIQYRVSGSAGGSATIVPNYEAGTLGAVSDFITDSGSSEDARARILSCYAGGYADVINGCYHPGHCGIDYAEADALLREWGWTSHENALREETRILVERHWKEIVAVATELFQRKQLDETEIEIIADLAAGTPDVSQRDLDLYRALVSASA